MTLQVITPENMSNQFDFGNITASKITLKTDDTTLVTAADGTLGLSADAQTIVSPAAANIINGDANGKALLLRADIQANETAWNGNETSNFMSITPGGINGHNVAFAFDYTNDGFVEGVQDAIGQAILANSNIVYDDVADSITAAIGNSSFGDGLNFASGTVTVLSDPNSPYTVGVTTAGVSVTPVASTDADNLFKVSTNDSRGVVDPADIRAALAVEEIQDAFGVPQALAFAL